MDPWANPDLDADAYRYSDGHHLTPNPRQHRERPSGKNRRRHDLRPGNSFEIYVGNNEFDGRRLPAQISLPRQPSPPRIQIPKVFAVDKLVKSHLIEEVTARGRQPSPPPRIYKAEEGSRQAYNYRNLPPPLLPPPPPYAPPPPPLLDHTRSEGRYRPTSYERVPSPPPPIHRATPDVHLRHHSDNRTASPPLPLRYQVPSPYGNPPSPTPVLQDSLQLLATNTAHHYEGSNSLPYQPDQPYVVARRPLEAISPAPVPEVAPLSALRSTSQSDDSTAADTRRHTISGVLPVRPLIVMPNDSVSSDVNRPRTASDVTSLSGNVLSRASSSSRAVKVDIYRYDPLDRLQIRLVKVQPVKGWKVKCEIFPASLESPPPYVAISYAWGDPDQRSEITLEREITDDAGRITVERTPYRVTTSLYGALDALRDKRSEVLVWVDALCINQKDNEERTKQIEMMTDIYRKAESVAIWLGPEADDSDAALRLLKGLNTDEAARKHLSTTITSGSASLGLLSLVALFEREYWDRLWVVQEVFNARSKAVYCGSTKISWDVFEIASHIFFEHKSILDIQQSDDLIDKKQRRISQNHFTYSQVLVYQGPSSLPDVKVLMGLEHPLLEVMRACRRKLTAKPHDKVFGILGVLPEHIRREFMVDYELSVKEVYIKVVDYVLSTTDRLDIIREAIHFPLHTGSAGLPTWCPDWYHIPEAKSLERSRDFPPFAASGETTALYRPVDEHRKLEISAVYLDTIKKRGIAVGTLTTLSDHIMAFLHWRALFLDFFDIDAENLNHPKHSAFCRTLCLNQILPGWEQPGQWETACYHAFASLINERLHALPMDKGLMHYLDMNERVLPGPRRPFLRRHFSSHMMGRCFFLTEDGHMGLGSGFMAIGDIAVVPLGCSTPIIVRPEGRNGEYRYVGDAYVDQYMMGKAVQEWEAGQKELRKYLLH